MWTFNTETGTLHHDNEFIATGYAGHGLGKDNPTDQQIPNVGPIPTGLYAIGFASTHPTLGPISIPLHPDPLNDMFGRSGFWIHGDNPAHPGQSSRGCIVLPAPARAKIQSSPDKLLTVTDQDNHTQT